ncbi:hypothetical protein Gotri_021987 [Gossypium trilobum]|uniref:Uncharacterized protein n=1 Tax=Gossypium trilobum TaxID=34281 RepID=A0A7J9DE94_9ROSI|nr:hypothetical protein [Gossypium trilobum]
MSPHKFKDYSMVKMDIDVRVVNATVDAIGKASGDKHLALFVFSVYGLIVFPKALGYVSVELADFLFQIEKWVNPTPTVLAETIISLNSSKGKKTGVS